MSNAWFPDNTVLCNFASVHALQTLKLILDGRGRWTEAVAFEARQSSGFHADLASLEADGWLGDPIEIQDEDAILAIERTRKAVFGGTSAAPLKHLGEAQTCYLIQSDPNYVGSFWISDDTEALRYARMQGITTRETIDILREGVAMGDIAPADAFQMMVQMSAEGRFLRMPRDVRDLTV